MERTFIYKQVGSLPIRADIYTPNGDSIRPAVLWIHGGALIFGDRGMLQSEQRGLYLRAGYVLVSIDYRLAPETKLAEILEDLYDAYAWLRAHAQDLRILPDRVFVVGHSAGGYFR